ncbi:hypothetical protein D3C80_1908330 [compost metagenome]
MQLCQIAVNAGIGTPRGQHHIHAFCARSGNRLFNSRRNSVVWQQQCAVHVDCNEFNGHEIPDLNESVLMLTRFRMENSKRVVEKGGWS